MPNDFGAFWKGCSVRKTGINKDGLRYLFDGRSKYKAINWEFCALLDIAM
jgi:hypothetical protein